MTEERVGCEEYLYKGMSCCLHPCNATDCPEPICAVDFPGGLNAYLRYKEVVSLLSAGTDIKAAAKKVGVSTFTAKRLYKKGGSIQQ